MPKSSKPTAPAAPTGAGGKVTINEIARLAGVSKKTVSRVINDSPMVRDETRKRVKEIIAEHHYTPDPSARALAFQRSFLIGMVYDNPSPQYVVNMQRGILDALAGTSFQLVLRPCDRGDPNVREQLHAFAVQQRPFGLILTPSVSEDEGIASTLRQLNCDYVRVASVELDEPHRMIRTQDAQGAAQAGRHLASMGHKLIGHIHGPETFRSTHERRAGFGAALAEFGLELDPAMMVEGAYTFDSGVKAAERLLFRKTPPTAIFAGNDEMAMGVYVAARKAGLRIPEDLSIVGFDDTPMASRVWPPMTTVRSPIREIGKAAAELLKGRLKGVPQDDPVTFEPEIVVRESTVPLR